MTAQVSRQQQLNSSSTNSRARTKKIDGMRARSQAHLFFYGRIGRRANRLDKAKRSRAELSEAPQIDGTNVESICGTAVEMGRETTKWWLGCSLR